MSTRRTGTFTANDEHGTRVQVDVFTEYTTVKAFNTPTQEIEGKKSFRTTDGRSADRIEKGIYEIVDTGERLTSASPNAP